MGYQRLRRRKIAVGLMALTILSLGLQACGPSVQFIYEGNIRFEHCYRLDFDENIAPTHRKACWEDWVLRYTQGQTRDRLDYARRRISEIDHGARGTLTLHVAGSKDAGDTSTLGLPAPIPTSLHKPPPARMAVPPATSVSPEGSTQERPARERPTRIVAPPSDSTPAPSSPPARPKAVP
jgi:hypothetical protein